MKFSIITCSFNCLPGVKEAVSQLHAQLEGETDFEIEHLIIDGGSGDGTADALRAWETGNGSRGTGYELKWISEPDKGLYDALNKGLRMASGDVIGVLHSDDVWEAGVLKHVFDVFSMGDGSLKLGGGVAGTEGLAPNSQLLSPISHADGVYGDLLYVEAEDISKVRRFWKAGSYQPQKFYQGWMPPHTTLFVRKELAVRCGEYRLDLGSAADYEWMLRACMVAEANLVYLPKVLVRMRVGGASNVSVQGRLKAHGADRRAWELNGLQPKIWTLKMKVIRKIPQWIIGRFYKEGMQ